jgi:hypothetical protein
MPYAYRRRRWRSTERSGAQRISSRIFAAETHVPFIYRVSACSATKQTDSHTLFAVFFHLFSLPRWSRGLSMLRATFVPNRRQAAKN